MTKAFNGDETLLERVKELVRDHEVGYILETGSFEAETTMVLGEDPELQIYTCELNETNFRKSAAKTHGHSNIFILNEDSPKFIKRIMNANADKLPEQRWLFFLDAHWNAYNPLIDELKAIAAAGIQPVILIHDFFVPGKSTAPGAAWGFDIYNNQAYDWDWVKPHVEAIYPNGFLKTYNSWYAASRGCLILEPRL